MRLFEPGRSGNPSGRPNGARNKIATTFLEALAEDFAEHGAAAIKIMRIERPADYVRVIASLMPRELEITSTQLTEVSDDELDVFITYARERLLERRATIDTSPYISHYFCMIR
jgi:UTP:GlnB (protein PII) uridylyltransferase